MFYMPIAMDNPTLLIVLLAAGAYVFTCARIARHAGRLGRSTVAWFVITLGLTALPAMVLFLTEFYRRKRVANMNPGDSGPANQEANPPAPPLPDRKLCPHCSRSVRMGELDRSSGSPTCPYCGMIIDEANYA